MSNPIRLLFILIVSVFAAELSIMAAFALLPHFPRWLENTLDASLLVVVLFPVLYFLVFRPMSSLIAQQMRMSADLERTNQLLHQEATEREKVVEKIATLNRELITITNEAESANRAKTSFMANISHEIRTPLHVITGLGHLLIRDSVSPLQQQRLDQLCATSDHLLSLINDILDLSKIEADQLILDDDPFRLGTVIDRTQKVVGELAREKGLTLVLDIAPALRDVTLRGDAVRLSQILINLGSNAVKFSDRGSIHIGMKVLDESETSLSLGFAVQDNGIGIAPEDQVRIFRPFEQADLSATRKFSGTGLGLTICQRLVSMMGGTIRLDSQPGGGSTFSFDLTLSKGASVPEAPSLAVLAPTIAGTRVLVAEDNLLSQEIMLEMLEDLGCLADIAVDGVEAVERAREHTYDLILMDMQMPRMDGLEATRSIRALAAYRDTPIIAVTANAFVEDRQRCLDAGMNGHLTKPVTPASLAAVFRQWLHKAAEPGGETMPFENELSRALMKIAGLNIGQTWRRSPERLVNYCTLLDRFVKLHVNDMAQMRDHLAAGDRHAAEAIVHKLKGIAGLIGAREVESLATELVQQLRFGTDQAGVLPLVDACDAELTRLTEAVETLPVPRADSAET